MSADVKVPKADVDGKGLHAPQLGVPKVDEKAEGDLDIDFAKDDIDVTGEIKPISSMDLGIW